MLLSYGTISVLLQHPRHTSISQLAPSTASIRSFPLSPLGQGLAKGCLLPACLMPFPLSGYRNQSPVFLLPFLDLPSPTKLMFTSRNHDFSRVSVTRC